MKKMLLIVLLSLFVCGIVNAANVTGVWQGEYNNQTVQMTLKQTGKRIKGSMVDVEEGVYMWSVKGKISGNKIELTFTGITDYAADENYDYVLEGDVMRFNEFGYNYVSFGRLYECKEVK